MSHRVRLILVVVVVLFALSMALTTRSGKKDYALLNKPAPAISGQTNDGETVDLSKHLGKDIVVLHFFTTLGPASAKALPVAASITGDLRDKGVVYYAINEKQSAAEVHDYLDKIQVTVPVIMDADGKLAGTYQVENLPTAVLISRDGSVHSVEPGYGDGFQGNLRYKLTIMSQPQQQQTSKTSNGDG